MSSTNKTTYYNLSQYVGSDKPTYLGDYNSDMLAIDSAIHGVSENASTAVSTANAASSAATAASTSASAAVTTANAASTTATEASNTASTALTNAGAALTAAQNAETKAKANDITNLAPAYDSTLTYDVDDLVTYVDNNGTGKLYKCIVAIATPEAFNVNKWDDVTASETFDKKMKFLARVTSDGVKTRSELLESLISNVTFGTNKRFMLKLSQPTDVIIYNSAINGTDNATFSYVQIAANAGYIDYYVLKENGCLVRELTMNTSGITITDLSNNVFAADIVLELYEII